MTESGSERVYELTLPQALAMGLQRHNAGDPSAARQICEQVLQRAPTNTDALWIHGLACQSLQDLGPAETSYRKALQLKPEISEIHSNLGNVLMAQERLEEAEACFRQALKLKPENAAAHKNLGILRLMIGDHEEGWREYEWRWRVPTNQPMPFAQRIWDGSALHGRTIYLHPEMGLGDTLQFVRYAALVKERGGTVIMECQSELQSLLATCPGVDRIVVKGQDKQAFDEHAPLLSLPAILGTTLGTIPAQVPYLFPDQQKVAQWKRELGEDKGFKVGIVWQGNPNQEKDRARSVRLERYASLAAVPGVQLYSLQKKHGTDQIAGVAGRFSLIDLGPRLTDMSDTAAAIASLDLIVTVDTAAAHLAGALAAPVWMARSSTPDWHWMLEREDSPWYPTMRLFRQDFPGDWDGVFRRIVAALTKRVEEKSRS